MGDTSSISNRPCLLCGPVLYLTVNKPLLSIIMKNTFFKIGIAAALAAAWISFAAPAEAQFSHSVVVMSGTVLSQESGKPTSVKVSVREAGDTAREITASTSNKETGKYLVVLQPGKKYWVHLESDSIMTQDVLVATPAVAQTEKLEQDFTVVLREVEDATKPSAPAQTN